MSGIYLPDKPERRMPALNEIQPCRDGDAPCRYAQECARHPVRMGIQQHFEAVGPRCWYYQQRQGDIYPAVER